MVSVFDIFNTWMKAGGGDKTLNLSGHGDFEDWNINISVRRYINPAAINLEETTQYFVTGVIEKHLKSWRGSKSCLSLETSEMQDDQILKLISHLELLRRGDRFVFTPSSTLVAMKLKNMDEEYEHS